MVLYTNLPNLVNEGINERCRVFSMYLYVVRMNTGMNANTVIRLIAIPFASTRPRSGPMRKRIMQSAW